jgi:hypothetical protein
LKGFGPLRVEMGIYGVSYWPNLPLDRCGLTCTILDTAEAVNCSTCDLKLDTFQTREGKVVDLLKGFADCMYCGSLLETSADDDI